MCLYYEYMQFSTSRILIIYVFSYCINVSPIVLMSTSYVSNHPHQMLLPAKQEENIHRDLDSYYFIIYKLHMGSVVLK